MKRGDAVQTMAGFPFSGIELSATAINSLNDRYRKEEVDGEGRGGEAGGEDWCNGCGDIVMVKKC